MAPHHGQSKAASSVRRYSLGVESERALVAFHCQRLPATLPHHAQGMAPCNVGRRVLWIDLGGRLVHGKGSPGAAGTHVQVAHLQVRQGIAWIDPHGPPVACLRLALAAEPRKRVPPARLNPRLSQPGGAKAVAHAECLHVRPAGIGMAAVHRHDVPLDQPERHHVLRARRKDCKDQRLDDGERLGHGDPYDVHGVRKHVPRPVQEMEPRLVRIDPREQGLHVVPLRHPPDRLLALKGLAGRLDPGHAQGDGPAQPVDRLDDSAPPARLFVNRGYS